MPEYQKPREEQVSAQLITLIGICEEMLAFAERGEWSRVADLEEHRKRVLTNCLAAGWSDQDKQVMHDGIAKMVSLNEELVVMASEARNLVGREVRRVRQGTRALMSYQDYAS